MVRTLVMYFSKTNTTKRVAEEIAEKLNANIYRIEEEKIYTSQDLNWNNPLSRANKEQEDDSSRPSFKGELPSLEEYDNIIIGHPLWWGRPPKIIQTVLEKVNLEGKKVGTFATSGGSTYTSSQEIIEKELKNIDLVKGRVLSSASSIDTWIKNFK